MPPPSPRRVRLAKERLAALQEEEAVMKRLADAGVKVEGVQQKRLDIAKQQLEVHEREYKLAGIIDEEKEKGFDRERKRNAAAEVASKKAEQHAKMLLGVTKDQGKMFENWTTKFTEYAESLGEALQPANLLGSSIKKIVESSFDLI